MSCRKQRVHPWRYDLSVREHAIDLIEDDGYTYEATAKTVGITLPTAWRWHQEFKAAGVELMQQLTQRVLIHDCLTPHSA